MSRYRFSVAGPAVLATAAVMLAAPDGHQDHPVRSGVASEQRSMEAPALPSDFNGDGVEDLAIAAPWDRPVDYHTSGAVHVVYSAGPDGGHRVSQYFTVDSPGIKRLLEGYPSLLGHTIGAGDFDRDGYADLAMSVPGADFFDPDVVGGILGNVGAVVVVYGTPDGLDPTGAHPAEIWWQGSPGVQGVPEDDDDFGSAFAVGDFDGDRFLDLAVGSDGEQTGPDNRFSGSVTVVYGSARGLTGRDQVVTQDTRGILDASERNDWAGQSLAAGDFNGDAVDDLAIGVASEALDGRSNSGAVNVVYGTAGVGLTGVGDRFVNQGLESVPSVPRRNELFGATLAVGDFDGDTLDDLAIGAPEDRVGGVDGAGSVTMLYGSATGLAVGESQQLTLLGSDPYWETNSSHFGSAVAAGDVDGDGADELAVGSSGYGYFDGRVYVFDGGPGGVSPSTWAMLSPDQFDLANEVPGRERMGGSLQFGDFDTADGADLLVGLISATLQIDGARQQYAGGAIEVFGESGQLSASGHRWLYQGAPGIDATARDEERLGSALPGSNNYIP